MNRPASKSHTTTMSITRVVLFLALLTGLATAARAVTLPWYEPFNYPIGNDLGTNESATVWSTGDSTGTGDAKIFPICNLSYSGLQTSNGTGGLIVPMAAANNRRRGALFTPIITNTGPAVLYGSFLLNVQTQPTSDTLIAALSSSVGTSPGSSANGIWLNAAGQLLISVNSTAATSAAGNTASLGTNTTHLVVTRYNTAAKAMSLWLDPATNTFGAAEGSVPAPNLNFTNSSGKTSVASFWIHSLKTGNPQCVFTLDELRLDTTWAAVTPAGATATPVATRWSFSKNPGYAGTGASVGTVEVQALDQNGNNFASSGVPVTLTLVGGGSLGGTVTKSTDSTGKATFTNITVATTGIKQLSAAGGSLAAGTSDYFSILSGSGGGSTPVVGSAVKNGSNLVLSGTGGQANQAYDVVGSTSLATAKTSWSLVGSSAFKADGSFSFTNSGVTGNKFFALRYTPSGGSLTLPSFAQMGWVNATNVTGGAGGPTVTVSNYTDFAAYLHYPAPLTIRVAGTITDPVAGVVANNYAVLDGPNKTIIGVGNDARLNAVDLRLSATNVIIRNLYFDVLPGGTNDCITIDGGSSGTGGYAWVDHCRFFNAQDGSLDVTKGADYVTVSWCQFAYSVAGNTRPFHRLVNLIGSSDTDSGVPFHVSFHHNWYGTNCMERMPSVRFGRVHVFNNYYACPTNDYCVRSRLYAQVLVENNYFDHVNNALEKYVNTSTTTEPVDQHGLLKATGNIFDGCTTNYNYILLNDASHDNPGTLVSSNATSITFTQGGTFTIINVDPFNDTLSDMNPVPYAYTLDAAASIPNTVTNFSGPGVILPLP